MRYFTYCRKSTEADDRQVLSLESQLNELKRAFGGDPSIVTLDVYDEAFSAKAPGRKLFNEMLARIERGEAEGIIAWHPDRLARNSVDAGKIIWLLDQKILKDLKFATYTFENNPQGKFMLSIFLGQSKYYVDALSENVKRGNRTKLEKGWRPNHAPLGYLNDRTTKTIVPDLDRFALVRRIFELGLIGSHSIKGITRETREWGLKTPQGRRIGGKYLTPSLVHHVLTNRFYAGIILWTGRSYPGAHKPIVTLEEFERVQTLLRRPGRPQPQKHSFPFTGLIRCGECASAITAEHKVNRFGTRYRYYHCTRKHLDSRCRQRVISSDALDAQFLAFIESLTIKPRVHQWLMARLRDNSADRQSEIRTRLNALDRVTETLARERNNLTTLRLRDLIDDAEFTRERQRIEQEQRKLAELRKAAEQGVNWIEPAQTVISGCKRMADWFQVGDAATKRTIIEIVGSNPILIDRKLLCEAAFPLISNCELSTCPRQLGVLDAIRTLWLDRDPKLLRMVAVFGELLERERKQQVEIKHAA
jgi:site-specific DNA recombinase